MFSLLGLLIVGLMGILPPAQAGDRGASDREQAKIFAFLDEFHAVDPINPPVPLGGLSVEGTEKSISAGGKQGQTRLINLWATWCPPCVEELPQLDRLKYLKADKGFDVWAVSTDSRMTITRIDYFLKHRGIKSLTPLLDSKGSLEDALKASALPISYLVDERGEAVLALYGPANWASRGGQAFIDRWRKDPKIVQAYLTRDKDKKAD